MAALSSCPDFPEPWCHLVFHCLGLLNSVAKESSKRLHEHGPSEESDSAITSLVGPCSGLHSSEMLTSCHPCCSVVAFANLVAFEAIPTLHRTCRKRMKGSIEPLSLHCQALRLLLGSDSRSSYDLNLFDHREEYSNPSPGQPRSSFQSQVL